MLFGCSMPICARLQGKVETMNVQYRSSRGGQETVSASWAIIKGLAEDGGLFVPDHFPKLEKTLEECSQLDYKELAYEVMKLFLSDFTEDELKRCIERAYDEKFDTEEIAPLAEVDKAYYLELFHGATIAFKDVTCK